MYSEQWSPYSPGRSAPEQSQPAHPRPYPDDTLHHPDHGFPPAYPQYPDPGNAGPGYPPPAYEQGYHHPGQEGSAIAVTPRYFPLAFLLELVKPVLIIDGHAVRMNWRNPAVVPVSPGPHDVHVHTPYLIPRRMGGADLVVTAAPGQTVELEYRPPLVAFLRGALGSAPQPYPGMAAFIILMIISVVLGICSAASALYRISEATARPAAAANAGAPAAGRTAIPELPGLPTDGPGLPTLGPDLPGSAPERPGPSGATGRPELRTEAPARKVTGATFAAGDRTGTRAFAGWPFAFRTPRGWTCTPQDDQRVPDAKMYGCTDGKGADSQGLVVVMLHPCAAPCGAAQMNQMHGFWFSPADEIRKAGATTHFAENAEGTATGGYELYLSHFFAAGRTGTPDWQVGVAAVAKSKAGRADAQKVLNDILSQTS